MLLTPEAARKAVILSSKLSDVGNRSAKHAAFHGWSAVVCLVLAIPQVITIETKFSWKELVIALALVSCAVHAIWSYYRYRRSVACLRIATNHIAALTTARNLSVVTHHCDQAEAAVTHSKI